MKIKWHLSIGLAGCTHEGEVEVDDGTSEEDIDAIVKEHVFDHIEWSWAEADE